MPASITNHHHHHTMPTTNDLSLGTDPQEPEQDFSICPDCGEDLPHHTCRPEK